MTIDEEPRYAVLDYIAVDLTNKVCMNPYDPILPQNLTNLKTAKSFCNELTNNYNDRVLVHRCPLFTEYGIKTVKKYVVRGDKYLKLDSTHPTSKLFEMFSFINEKGDKIYIIDENVYLKTLWRDERGYNLPFFDYYVPQLKGLAKTIYDQSCHKINIPYFNISMEEKDKLFSNLSLNDMEINLLKAIANNDGEYYIQSTSFGNDMIIVLSLLKAMNKQSPDLINIILLPYTTSKDNFKSMLISHGFTVGDIEGNNGLIHSTDVYIGSYQSGTDLNTLLKDSKPGLLFLQDCHQLIQKDKPNIRESSIKFNFNRFSRILMMSHIMNADIAQSLRKVLRLNNEIKIRSIYNEIPYKNRIQIKNMIYDNDNNNNNNIEDEITNILIKFLSHSRGKCVVISDNKDKLHELYHNFNSSVNSDCSLLLFEDSIDKTSITNKFQNDPKKRVLITTEYDVNDFEIPNIQVVILYEYNPKIEIFIKILNFIKFKGMILIFDENLICRTSEVEKFYNITPKGHQNCCNHFIDDKFIKKLNQVITEPFSFGYVEDEIETNKRKFSDVESDDKLSGKQNDNLFSESVDISKRRKIEDVDENMMPALNSSNELNGNDSSKTLIDKAGSFSSIGIKPVIKNNFLESSNKNSFNESNLLGTFTNDEVELHFRSLLPKDFAYFDTRSITSMNKILDEDIGDVRNRLIGLENLYEKFPILKDIKSENYKLYDYLLIEHVFKDPMFICSFAEIVHLSCVVPDEKNIVRLCAVFVLSIFEGIKPDDIKERIGMIGLDTLKKASGYLKEFKMITINLIKYQRKKIESPKSDKGWKRYYKGKGKKLRSYGWGNKYKNLYPNVQMFTEDPVYSTPLYVSAGTCINCFGSCKGCALERIAKGAKLTVFQMYLDKKELKGVPEELAQLKKCKLFSIYLILCLTPGNGYRCLCHGLV
ncbi:hypothetical protein DAPK24_040240 [Pichia kluyveri]|uniref:Helicase ATP-binding domain-containing protein n=1 Tax=Pichia kluyveri TaxID=36015 RepID=A0AAV5RA06_PICKL|nr:hypothetical protein DAPK24_040240 [Pichia kluyveri]